MMKTKKIFSLIGILFITCVSVIGISFTYASITSKLSIDGYASMNSMKWSVHFQNLSNANLKGTTLEVNKPTLKNNSTSISDFEVEFMNINDGVSYTFDVINDGDLDAKISSIVMPKPVCTSTGDTAYEDSSLICDNLNYSLTYLDGTEIQIGDTLEKGQSKSLVLKLEYLGTKLPQNVVGISGLSIALIYVQK